MATTGSPLLPPLAIINSILICCHLCMLWWLACCCYSILHSWRDWALERMIQSFSEMPHIAAHLMGQEAAGDAKVYKEPRLCPTPVSETADPFPLLLRTKCNYTTRMLIPLACWLSARLSHVHWQESILDLSSSSVQWKVMLFGIWPSNSENPEFYT